LKVAVTTSRVAVAAVSVDVDAKNGPIVGADVNAARFGKGHVNDVVETVVQPAGVATNFAVVATGFPPTTSFRVIVALPFVRAEPPPLDTRVVYLVYRLTLVVECVTKSWSVISMQIARPESLQSELVEAWAAPPRSPIVRSPSAVAAAPSAVRVGRKCVPSPSTPSARDGCLNAASIVSHCGLIINRPGTGLRPAV
jgi:hypothetical protein